MTFPLSPLIPTNSSGAARATHRARAAPGCTCPAGDLRPGPREPHGRGGSGAARTNGLEPAASPQRGGRSVPSGELGKPGSGPGGAEVWWRGQEPPHTQGQGRPRAGEGPRWPLGHSTWAVAGLSPLRFSVYPPSSPLLGDAWRSAYLA